MDYDGYSYCGHQTREAPIGLATSLPRWPHKAITWRVDAHVPSIARDAYRASVAEAFARWSRVCGIQPREVDAGRPANIVLGLQRERPGNVLADCQLPFPGISATASLQMRVDTEEVWCISDNPPRDRIDLTRVICHELGHGLGCSHLGSAALMAPTYSLRIKTPQAEDIAQMVARYGQPVPVEAPEPPKSTPEGEAELLRILNRGGKIVVRFADGREVQA